MTQYLRFIPGSVLVVQSSEPEGVLQQGDIINVGFHFQIPIDISEDSEADNYGIKNASYQVMLYPLMKSLEEPIDSTYTVTMVRTGARLELVFPRDPKYGLLAVLTQEDAETEFNFKPLEILYLHMEIIEIERWIITLVPVGRDLEDTRIEAEVYISADS